MKEPRLLQVGVAVKPHGIKGEVFVIAVTDDEQRFSAGETLFDEAGKELRILESRSFKNGYLIRFEGMKTRDAAEDLRSARLYAQCVEDEEGLYIHEMAGAVAVDQKGRELGTVVELELNPAHDLLVLDSGVLIPVVFVKVFQKDEKDRKIVVDVPEGLTEL